MIRAAGRLAAAIVVALGLWIARPRRSHQDASAAPRGQKSRPERRPIESPLRGGPSPIATGAVILPVVLTAVGLGGLLTGLSMRPPTLELPDATQTLGGVEVFVSDPAVDADLSVQVFDWADWTRYDEVPALASGGGHAFRMIMWLSGNYTHPVRWAVVLSGSARYRHPLPLAESPEIGPAPDDPGEFVGATIRDMGRVQIIEGWALVGPDAITDRPADWAGEAVGPFIYRSGSWPEFGSQALIRLPAFHAGVSGTRTNSWFGRKGELFGPEDFEASVYFGSSSLPEFLRVEYADPPLTGNALAWNINTPWDGPTVLLVDIPRAQEEAQRADLALAALGLAGGALLSALAAWVVFAGKRLRRSPD